jgi:2,3-bisphosphoglycerate-independent phosphoglycerate mutase
MEKRPVLLIIRDGWGEAAPGKFNAVTTAKTPYMDYLRKTYPASLLEPSGESVGLPAGYQGSSEVGHLNMGAGRIVVQELKRIRDMIESGELFRTPALKAVIDNCLKNRRPLHLMGLVQDEGVHAHEDHMFAIMRHAVKLGVGEIYIHFFADGRDTPPRSALAFVKTAENKIKEIGAGKIATVIGRYYAMDRNESWPLVEKAFECLMGTSEYHAATAEEAVSGAYETYKSPDGSALTDEYIPPTIIGGFTGIKDGDSVLHFNFRQDRAIELAKAFVDDVYPGRRSRKPEVVFCGLTRYYDTFKYNALSPMDEDDSMGNLLGEVISAHGLKQLRLAETQKFKHVTSFFNGKMLKPYPGEDRIEIKGTWDPATYADHPEMNAREVADEAVRQIKTGKYDFIAVNLANCDMVGHTGNMNSVVKAVGVVDECLGKMVPAALEKGYYVLVTSDHGNAEEMWDDKIGMPKTSHTCNLVTMTLCGAGAESLTLRARGILADIAPTALALLGVDIPREMSAQSLIEEKVSA